MKCVCVFIQLMVTFLVNGGLLFNNQHIGNCEINYV